MSFSDAWNTGIQSAVTEPEARILYSEARAAPGCVVEIGAWHGRTAILLAHAVAARGGHVHTIDPFDGSVGVGGSTFSPRVAGVLRENLKRHAPPGSVTYHHARSVVVAARGGFGPVSLLWIDGDHSPRGAEADWRSWVPHLTCRARVALHNIYMPGPASVIEAAQHNGWEVDRAAGRLVVLSRL